MTIVTQLDTNSRLADRVDNIRILKDLLERTAAALEREISNLNEAKQNLEYALDQRVGLAVHVNVENLVSREGRRDGDIVEDVIEVELHKVQTSRSCRSLTTTAADVVLHLNQRFTCKQIFSDIYLLTDIGVTSMSVLLTVGPKCTLAASRAASSESR